MDLIQSTRISNLLDKNIKDSYRTIRYKLGQLCALISDLFQLIMQSITIISLLFIAAQYSIWVACLTILYLITCYWIYIKNNGKLTYDFDESRIYESRAKYYEQCVLEPGIAKEVRIFGNVNKIVKEWSEEYKYIRNRDIRIAYNMSRLSFGCSIGYYALVLVILIYSISQIKNHLVTVSAFLVLYEMARNMSNSILQFSSTLYHFKRELQDMAQVKQFIDNVPQDIVNSKKQNFIKKYEGLSKVVLEARNLCFSYDKEKEILHNVNFKVYQNEIIALVGLNGSGKSTLVRLISELYKPTKGQLLYNGISYNEYPEGYISGHIGIYFQDSKLLHTTLGENVGFGDIDNVDNEIRIVQALKDGGADVLLPKLNNGINTWLLRDVKKDGIQLSGGEQQRVVIARTHMSNKSFMIFDEPASALDPIAEIKQFNVIKEKMKGKTGILISHRVGFARLADRILVLQDGKIMEEGTHEKLLHQKGIYAKFFEKQSKWYQID